MSAGNKPKLRFFPSILLFVSSYSPLSIIFMILDYDFTKHALKHPSMVWTIFCVSISSCLLLWRTVRASEGDSKAIIKSASNRSGDLINYSIPYIISFFGMDLGNTNMVLSFSVFMCLMYWLTVRTHNIFINPTLAAFGYNLFDVHYEWAGEEYQALFLCKGEPLRPGQLCETWEISEQLFLVTDPNPKV